MKTLLRSHVIFRSWYLTLAPLILTLLTTSACERGKVQAAAPAMPAPLVTVVKATAQDVPRYLDEIGRNAAFESVTVTPQVGGRIVERHFQDGISSPQRKPLPQSSNTMVRSLCWRAPNKL